MPRTLLSFFSPRVSFPSFTSGAKGPRSFLFPASTSTTPAPVPRRAAPAPFVGAGREEPADAYALSATHSDLFWIPIPLSHWHEGHAASMHALLHSLWRAPVKTARLLLNELVLALRPASMAIFPRDSALSAPLVL